MIWRDKVPQYLALQDKKVELDKKEQQNNLPPIVLRIFDGELLFSSVSMIAIDRDKVSMVLGVSPASIKRWTVLNRDQVLQQAVYNRNLWRGGKFWVPAKTKLYEVIDQNPIFHRLNRLAIFDSNKTQDLKNRPDFFFSVTAETVKKNADIKTNLYMAPFSLAWTIQRNEHCSEKANKDGNLLTGQAVDKDQKLLTKSTKPAIPTTPTTVAGGGALVLRVIWHFVFPFDKFFIHSHYDDLQAYDNPAFLALITYKWTRFARYFFCLRLLFQLSYEVLVLVVTLFQLYGDEEQRSDLIGGYITVIVLGYMLLHLEFQ
ncbi:MAG: hypothetical protein BYD32DRAFT_435220 [Podila humilis]|nr:MAG: hypothetical protein BYD32DRAFT_435220 [Podila humilis]